MHSFLVPEIGALLRFHDLPGREPTCVYLPGLGWAAAVAFARVVREARLVDARALLVDFLGAGFSERPADFTYSLEGHARSVAALLDHLQLRACAVIGHSMGGSVAITLAALRPDLVARLVIAEGNLDPGGGGFSRGIADQSEANFVATGYAAMLAQMRAAALAGNAMVAAFLASLQVAAPHGLHRTATSLVRGTEPMMRERFLQMTIPRTFIVGEQSLQNPDMASIAAGLPSYGIAVATVPGAGHGMMIDNPTGFAQAVAAAIDERT